MSYTVGDIVLVRFPYTDLKKSKIRPVLVVKNANRFDDVVCFQITSKQHSSAVIAITKQDFVDIDLKRNSFVRYDKCYTLHTDTLGKVIAKVNQDFLQEIKQLFCDTIL